MAMDGTASDKDHTINESNADRRRDHESMEVGATAPERTPGLPQRCLSSKHSIIMTSKVGRGASGQGQLRDSWGLGVAPNRDRNKAFNYQNLSRLVCRGDEVEAFVVVYS